MSVAYIVDAVRTAGGRRNGKLAGWHPVDLGAEVVDALLARTGIDPNAIDDVIIGCVSQAGEQTFAFARNVVLASKLPQSVPGLTIDRQCGSSQQAVHLAAQAVMSGFQDVIIAGGVESMSRVPMFSPSSTFAKAGLGADPLTDRIKKRFGVDQFSQFSGAEMMVKKYNLNKQELDQFSLDSHLKAIEATNNGAFKNEIIGLDVDGAPHLVDEGIRFDATLEGIAGVKAISEGGVLSAANASQICDGSSAVLIVNEKALKQYGLIPMAKITHLTVTAGDPVIMLEEPINATRVALKKAGLSIDDIDLYEVNEAFAPVPMAWLKELNADPAKLNVNGGAIALGHPLGSSGTKLMTTLVHALKQRNLKYGLQTMCEGGGMANVTIIEAL